MGSFTEGVLDFDFRADTPGEVLAAFAALADPGAIGAPAVQRQLPSPVIEALDGWSPDWAELGRDPDPYADQPWRHDWAHWLSISMGLQTSYGWLSWSSWNRWHLSCRFSWKTMPEGAFAALEWLGRYVAGVAEVDPSGAGQLIGYLKHEAAPRPHLVWIDQQGLRLEDLNPNDLWQVGGVRAPVLQVIVGLPGAGKSHHLAQLERENPGCGVYDDFQADSVRHSGEPMRSRYFGALLDDLLGYAGRAVVTDVRYCNINEVKALISAVRRCVPGVRVSVTAIAPDVAACEHNLRHRAESNPGRNLQADLDRLSAYAAVYQPGKTTLPVTRAGS